MAEIGEPRWCSRCDAFVRDEFTDDSVTTSGYYDVRTGSWWSQFAYPGEDFVCDKCMWQDPRYIKVYGRHE